MTRNDWVGKVIHWELCKKSKFDHTARWYLHIPASVLENEMHKTFWDFEIQTDHLLPSGRPGLIIINKQKKRTYWIVDFDVSADHKVKIKENGKKWQIFRSCQGTKKAMEHEDGGDIYCNWYTWNIPKGLVRGVEELEFGGQAEIIQTTALLRSARILRRVLETWEDLLSHTLQWKTANAGVKNSQGVI